MLSSGRELQATGAAAATDRGGGGGAGPQEGLATSPRTPLPCRSLCLGFPCWMRVCRSSFGASP